MNTRKLAEIATIIIGLAVILMLLERFQSLLRPLTFAIILSFIFTPLFKLNKDKRKIEILKMCGHALLLIIFVSLMSFFIIKGLADFATTQSMITSDSGNFITQTSIDVAGHTFSISDFIDINSIQSNIKGYITTLLSSITSFVSELFMVMIFLVFILPAMNIWIKKARQEMGKTEEKKFLQTIDAMESGIKSYLSVKTLVSFGTGIVSYFIMLAFGIEHAVLFASLIFLLNYIPTIGSIIAVALILVIEAILLGFTLQFFALGILLIIVQIIFGNIIEPKITGERLSMSPLTILIGLFFWGAIWGIGGMLFSAPLTLAIKTYLKNQKTTEDIAKYIV